MLPEAACVLQHHGQLAELELTAPLQSGQVYAWDTRALPEATQWLEGTYSLLVTAHDVAGLSGPDEAELDASTASRRDDADPARADDAILEFTGDGKFVKQIGVQGASQGDADVLEALLGKIGVHASFPQCLLVGVVVYHPVKIHD